MFVGIVRLKVRDGMLDDGAALWRRAAGALPKQNGFRGGVLLKDLQHLTLVHIGFWRTRAECEAFMDSPDWAAFAKTLAKVTEEPPKREMMELVGSVGEKLFG